MDIFNNPDTAAEMMEQLLTITTIHGLAGKIQSGERIVLYQCQGTGLYFPGDYLEMWGRKYGFGLGKKPVSECLESEYNRKPAMPKRLKDVEQIMFPLKQGGHDIAAVVMSLDDAKKCKPAILMINDPHMYKRSKVLRKKQLDNPNGLLKQIIYQKKR